MEFHQGAEGQGGGNKRTVSISRAGSKQSGHGRGEKAERAVTRPGGQGCANSSVDCRLENGSAMSVKEEKRQERRKQGQESRQRDSEVEGGH